MELSDFHREQITKYLRFFRQKRQVQVQEIQELFNDVTDGRLDGGSLLSPEEVVDILRNLCDSVKSSYEEDLRRTVSMSVLAIQQLFEDADAQDVELQMETSKIEDSHLIAEVEKIRLDGPSTNGNKKAGRLVSLRDEQQRIVDQNARLQAQVDALKKENERMQDAADKANQQISNFTYEVESLKRQLESIREKGSSAAESKEDSGKLRGNNGGKQVHQLQEELDQERDLIVQLRAELADARDLILEQHGIDINDITSSFKNSKQFMQLRKTLTQKTDQLTDLRRRMLQYEPDETRIERDYRDAPLRHK